MVMFNLRLSLSKKGDDRLFGETPIVIFHYALTHSNAYLDGKENCTNLQSWTPFVLTKKNVSDTLLIAFQSIHTKNLQINAHFLQLLSIFWKEDHNMVHFQEYFFLEITSFYFYDVALGQNDAIY